MAVRSESVFLLFYIGVSDQGKTEGLLLIIYKGKWEYIFYFMVLGIA